MCDTRPIDSSVAQSLLLLHYKDPTGIALLHDHCVRGYYDLYIQTENVRLYEDKESLYSIFRACVPVPSSLTIHVAEAKAHPTPGYRLDQPTQYYGHDRLGYLPSHNYSGSMYPTTSQYRYW